MLLVRTELEARVPVVLRDHACFAVTDSGAQISIIPVALADGLNLQPCRLKLIDVNGQEVSVAGQVELELCVGRERMIHSFVVADTVNTILLGFDFLKLFRCSLDFDRMQLRVGHSTVDFVSDGHKARRHKEVGLCAALDDSSLVEAVSTTTSKTSRSMPGMTAMRCEVAEQRGSGTEHGRISAVLNVSDDSDSCALDTSRVSTNAVSVASEGEKRIDSASGRALDSVAELQAESNCETSTDRFAVLRTLVDDCRSTLSKEQQEEVWCLLVEFADVFSVDETDVGRTDLISHRIETTDSLPVKIPPRRLPIAKRDLVQREIDRWLSLGIIRESHSAYSAPVVLVQRGSKVRLCIDYRRLNDKTIKDAAPSPNIDTILDALAGSTYFCCLDLRSGFMQIPMDPRDICKTAFCTESNLYEFLFMPFGLTNAPATCIRLVEQVFANMSPKALLAFIDDIMVHARTFNQTLANLREALSRLKHAGLKVNAQKVRLFQRETKFLGHVVSESGVRPDEDKVKTVTAWPRPENITQLKSFLGLCSYERRFIPNFSHIAKPLFDLTKKRVKYIWTESQESAFGELKRLLSTAPVLSHYDPDADLVLETDCSLHGAGSILFQVVDGQERVVAYYSKLLSKTQRNYCATKRELLSIVLSLAHFHVYLYGHKRFTVRTDHSSLRWLLNFKDLEGQLARWLERLQLYDFEIVYRAGTKIPASDALSRRPCNEQNCRHCQRVEDSVKVSPQGIETMPSGEETDKVGKMAALSAAAPLVSSNPDDDNDGDIGLVCFISLTESDTKTTSDTEPPLMVNLVRVIGIDLAQAQLDDDTLGPIVRAKLAGTPRPKWEDISIRDTTYKAWWSDWDTLEIRDKLLCRRWVKDSTNKVIYLPAVPTSLQNEVLKQVHDSVGAGHFGRRKTLLRLKESYYWPQRSKSVLAWCQNCTVCARRKGPVKRQHGPLQRYCSGAPMERVGIDILGPLPITDRGNRYLLVAMDYFTKWPEAIPLPNQEATTIAEALVNNFFCRFGACQELHSDQGRNFESTVMAEVCKLFGVHKTRTTALYPQSDGLVERFNSTLLNSLSAFVSENQRDWDLCTPLVLLAYRTAVHESTGVAPCEAMMGRLLMGPLELAFPRPDQEQCNVDSQYVQDLTAHLESVQKFVRANLELTGLDLKRHYDRHADRTGFSPGDAVWLYNPRVPKGRSPKLGRPWAGPYRVMERVTDVVYRIQATSRSKPYTVNRYRLWKVSGSLPDDWWTGQRNPVISPETTESTEQPDPNPEDDENQTPPQDAEEDDPDNFTDPITSPLRVTRSGREVRRPRRYLLSLGAKRSGVERSAVGESCGDARPPTISHV